ncbi:helical backbone metal receptor [Piscinibacter sp. HJYY11]|uniref:helical backbone metal receptor n=1 Tax=Piscinibacter sp. HJYY11 TaxID=2801333 RepID=UPI00191CE7F5|nr:helical backbone metal receptor [Piscinibacter sp. HJYY11]MBL0729047.1 ABC transporter substrate-binding protein [Piscinibacter sp. HJYY11]
MTPNLQDIRIASLVPSLTELVVALGLGSRLVARTGFCIHPAPQLREVPKVGGTKDVNLAKLRQLAPTHVLVNVDENRLDIVPAVQAMGAKLLVTHPRAPDDNLALVAQLVEAFGHLPGVAERGEQLQRALRDELARNREFEASPETVLYLIWHDPWMTVARDTYISRMLATVHWHTVPELMGGDHGAARYPVVRGDEAWLASVRRVLLSSEPFRFEDAHAHAAQALCPQAVVQRVDGELVSWYGPRAVPGLRYLRELAAA